MKLVDVPLDLIDISPQNVRKNMDDGETDGGIAELARAIERQGLLSPPTLSRRPDGRYDLIAGQRRLRAVRFLGHSTIAAIIREDLSERDATAISLIENVHRADMNPMDKADAFKTLLDDLGTVQAVQKETGVSVSTIKKYLQLQNLAPELQQRCAAGETRSTEALARLGQAVPDYATQVKVHDKIGGFTQDIQQQLLRQISPDAANLDDLVERAHEGAFDIKLIRNCPWDCDRVPGALKRQVADLIRDEGAA